MKKTVALLLVALMAVASVFANGAQESAGKAGKEYVIAANCEWPPLEYVDENGNITGYEIELLEEIGKATGNTFVIRNVAWDGIFAGMANGQYDGVASGVSITEDRKKTMAFTQPIFVVTQAILSPAGKTELNDIDSIKDKVVGVQMGTTGHFAAEAAGIKNIKAYDAVPYAVEDLINGNLDCVVCDSIVASDYVLSNQNYVGKLEVTGTLTNTEAEEIAMCTLKNNTELIDVLNKGIDILKENGTIDKLKAKYNLL